ncbi:hypothetical protein [Cupriavidus sp. IDO]|uniref:hypothetical protein n=1 Tax=Cupriavidus sp. IDO TaxID=1539142 RepID=UPI000A8C6082|nr:hypothetical protein [Cupriavidus sp. IDO]
MLEQAGGSLLATTGIGIPAPLGCVRKGEAEGRLDDVVSPLSSLVKRQIARSPASH